MEQSLLEIQQIIINVVISENSFVVNEVVMKFHFGSTHFNWWNNHNRNSTNNNDNVVISENSFVVNDNGSEVGVLIEL